MNAKLYVGNLSYNTTEEGLRTLFSQAGTVTSVDLIKDRDTGSSKGFAFVEMSSQSESEQAIKTLNGYMLDNRPIKVNVAKPREERPKNNYSSGGGGSSRNSYGSKKPGAPQQKRRTPSW